MIGKGRSRQSISEGFHKVQPRKANTPLHYASIVFLVVFQLFSGQISVSGQFGGSGGVRNESDVPIRLKIIFENGDYEWQQLSPGVSLDFQEEVAGVGFYNHAQHPINSRTRIRIVVFHPDGSLQTLEKLEEFVSLLFYKEIPR